MNRIMRRVIAVPIFWFGFAGYTNAQLAVLHSFSDVFDQTPWGDMGFSGSTLYGTTENGGANLYGTIFRLNTDGTGLSSLHSFGASSTDGIYPRSGTVFSGSTVYGTTDPGGNNNNGTIFKINGDGTSYGILHSFAGGTADGSRPVGGMTVSGAILYGTTIQGGATGSGTVFKINTNGAGFSILHSFGSNNDGVSEPLGPLLLSGSTLYGTTYNSTSGYGSVFKVNTDGTGFAVLHLFAGGNDGGFTGTGLGHTTGLAIFGSTLYGAAQQQGGSSTVIVYRPHGEET